MNERSESSPGKWPVFALVAVGIFMSTLDGSIVNIALPNIMADFATDMTRIRWVVIAYLLAVSSLLLSFGRLSDIVGRRPVYLFGLVIFTAGSFSCGMAGSTFLLAAGRVFQAVGAAMILACKPALIVDVFPVSERGKSMGMVGMVVALGLTMGPYLGGLILTHFSWRMIFYVNVPVGILAILATLAILRRETGRLVKESFDFAGAVLLTGSFAGFLMLLASVADLRHAAYAPAAAGLFGVCGALLVMVLKRRRHPILDPGLFKIRLFSASIAAAVAVFTGLACVTFLMPFFLVNPAGFSEKTAGEILVAPFLFLFVIAPFSGAASDRMGSRILSTSGLVIMSLALVSLALLKPAAGKLDILIRLSFVGVGMAVFSSPNSAAAMTAVPMKSRGVAAATIATARNLGMVTGVALASALFNARFSTLTGHDFAVYGKALEGPFMKAFSFAMLAGALMAALGALASSVRGTESARENEADRGGDLS